MTADAERATRALVAPPTGLETPLGRIANDNAAVAPTPAASPAVAATASSASVNLQGATFVFNGVANAEEAESRFSEALTRILEGGATQLGAGEAA